MPCLPASLLLLLLLSFGTMNGQATSQAQADETISQLRQSVSELTQSYGRLCQELAHLSRYVAFHEKALEHISRYSHKRPWTADVPRAGDDHAAHSHSSRPHDHLSQVQRDAHVTQAPVESKTKPDEAINVTVDSLIDSHSHHRDTFHHELNSLDSSECQLKVTDTCSVFRRVTCRHVGPFDSTLSFDQQFKHWFLSLTSTHEHLSVHHRDSENRQHHHHRYAHSHEGSSVHHHSPGRKGHLCAHDRHASAEQELNSTATDAIKVQDDERKDNATAERSEESIDQSPNHPSKRSNDWSDSLIVPQYIQEMESSIANDNNGSDFIYATCEVQANRAISLLLQENIEGRINLWQRRDASSPLYAHIKLSGFRVPSSAPSSVDEVARGRRETVLIPVETSARDADKPPHAHKPLVSLEHAFHVHSSGDLSRSCQSTGPHFSPLSEASDRASLHSPRHTGDLGNLKCKADGTIDSEYTYPHVSLVGANSIVGRSLVIHSAPDPQAQSTSRSDLLPHVTNDSRVRIACCVVRPVATLPPTEDSASLMGSLIVASSNTLNHGAK